MAGWPYQLWPVGDGIGSWPVAECLHEHREDREMLVEGPDRIFYIIVARCPECKWDFFVDCEGTDEE